MTKEKKSGNSRKAGQGTGPRGGPRIGAQAEASVHMPAVYVGKSSRGNIPNRAFIPVKTTLYAHQAQDLMKRMFVSFSNAMHSLSIFLPKYSKEESKKVSSIVDSHLAEIMATIDTEIEQFSKLCLDAGVDPSTVENTGPVTYNLDVVAPRVQKFIQIVTRVDEYIRCAKAAWLAGAIDEIQLTDYCHEIERTVRKGVSEVQSICDRAMKGALKDQKEKANGEEQKAPLAVVADTATESAPTADGDDMAAVGEEQAAEQVA